MTRSSRRWLLICLTLGIASCSLVVDPNGLKEGCPDGTKSCFGRCVSKGDPEYGCGRAGCAPCGLAHATANCNAANECGVAVCAPGFGNCDRLPANGCEVNTRESLQYCGSCLNEGSCQPAADGHVKTAACGGGSCYVLECGLGYLDCNDKWNDGCEYAVPAGDDAGACPPVP